MSDPRRVIVFRSRLRPGVEDAYGARADDVYGLAEQMPGLVAAKDFVAEDGERLSVIEFDTEEHLAAWREHPEHRKAQQEGRDRWYSEYEIRICVIERESRFRG